MAKSVVVWTEALSFKWAELREGTPAELGRNPEADISLGHATVSRKHARLIHRDGKLYIENLSLTNPTKVNQIAIQTPTPLTDGDAVRVGTVDLVFHELRSADRSSGLVCSHCSRENRTTDKDCWYCGTSLVNAPTIVARRLTLVFRVVSEAGSNHNLYAGEIFSVSLSGEGAVLKSKDVPADAAAVVTTQDGNPILVPVSTETAITVNDGTVSDMRELQTGDDLRVGEGHFLFITP